MFNKGKKQQESKGSKTKEVIKQYTDFSETDPNGSYTGVLKNKDEIPVQDADDL